MKVATAFFQNHLLSFFPNKKLLFIALSILAFVLIRFCLFYDYKALWIDEQISINAACGDSTLNAYSFDELKQIRIQNVNENNFLTKVFYANIQNDRSNALLYDYTLSAWVHFFGLSLFSVRALSLICFVFVLFFATEIAKELNIQRTFLILLLLSSSLLFRYNMEARTYLFTLCLSLFSTVLLLRFQKNSNWGLLIAYLGFVLLCLFSHYLVIVVFIWHAVMILFSKEKNQKQKLFIGFIIVGLVFVSLLFLIDKHSGFITGLSDANNNITQQSAESSHFRPSSFANIIIGLIQVLSQNFGLSLQSDLPIRYFTIFLLIPIYFILRTFKTRNQNSKFFLTMVFTHVLFLILVSAISGNTTIFQLSYSIFMLPYYLLYFSQLCTQLPMKKFEQILKWGVIIFSLSDTIGYIYLA